LATPQIDIYELIRFMKDDVILVLLINLKYWARRDSNP
jgi:hypothetical protein